MRDVLLIEGDSDLRAALRDLLELCGFQVHASLGAHEALALFDRLDRPPCVLLDFEVHGGAEILKALVSRSGPRAAPIIVFSAEPPPLDPRVIAVRKPFNPETLLEILTRSCQDA